MNRSLIVRWNRSRIAASTVRPSRRRQPQPQHQRVSCHHQQHDDHNQHQLFLLRRTTLPMHEALPIKGETTTGQQRYFSTFHSNINDNSSSRSNNNNNNNNNKNNKKKKKDITSTNKAQIVLQKYGDIPYGSREYRLVLQRPPTHRDDDDDDGDDRQSVMVDGKGMVHEPIASLRGHRNIIFGAKVFVQQNTSSATSNTNKKSMKDICAPLLEFALEDASSEGEQPQAMATLHGLCDWVSKRIEEYEQQHTIDQKESPPSPSSSSSLEQLQTISQALYDIKMGNLPHDSNNNNNQSYEAIKAIATGIPRPGHSVVGQGTYRDGENAWMHLAKEYCQRGLAEEVTLYKSRGGTIVAMEHLADTQPKYLKSAGGTMVRLFFL